MKGDNSFLLDLEGVFEKLKEKGASQDVSLYVEDLLVQQHQRYHNFMTAEADKRRRLLEHVQKLQVIRFVKVPCLVSACQDGGSCRSSALSPPPYAFALEECSFCPHAPWHMRECTCIDRHMHIVPDMFLAGKETTAGIAGEAVAQEVSLIS